MTTKQLAETLGKPEKTVRTWAAKASAKTAEASAKLAEAQRSGGTPADWTLDETLDIIEQGMGKNAADIFRMNAIQSAQRERGTELTQNVGASGSFLTEKDIQLITTLTAGIVSQVMSNLDSRVQKIEGRIEQRQALLPAPKIKSRDHVSMLVREHAKRAGCEFSVAWRELYRQFGYRTNTNPTQCAKNRGMAIIDYIEAEGMIETLESVAIETMGKEE